MKTEKGHECVNTGKVKWLELWGQLYVTWLTENFRALDFCWTECTDPLGHETLFEEHCTASVVQDFVVIRCKCCVVVLVKCFVYKNYVYYIFIIPVPSVTCVVDWASNLRGEILPRSLRNVVSFLLGVKWAMKIKVEHLKFLLYCVWGFSRDG
jgi:hypothetical protein